MKVVKIFKKKFKLISAISVAIVIAIGFGACGEEGLEKAYLDIEKAETDESRYVVDYDEGRDLLEIGVYSGCDIDALFDILNRDINGKEVGSIYFRTYYTLTEDELDKLDENIGKLSCDSMKMLGVNVNIAEIKNHKWMDAINKADVLYCTDLWVFDRLDDAGKKKLANVKKIWVEYAGFNGIENFSDAEELAICVDLDIEDSTAEEDDETNDYATKSDDAKNNVVDGGSQNDGIDTDEDKESVYEFSEPFDDPEIINPLANAKSLDHIFIAPQYDTYIADKEGSEYIYAMSMIAPDVKINPPEEKFSEDDLVALRDTSLPELDKDIEAKGAVASAFLGEEIKDVYEKAVKFKESEDAPKITGKSLVYLASPDSTGYKEKKAFYADGHVLTSKELGSEIGLAERPGDYDTFIYAYPIYKKTGKYDTGTVAYKETYYVQVFDLKNKIAYKSQKAASAAPPKTFDYPVGDPPDKWAGSVKAKKIYDFIKAIK